MSEPPELPPAAPPPLQRYSAPPIQLPQRQTSKASGSPVGVTILVAAIGLIFLGGIFAAIMLPALARAREAARRATCQTHLRDIGIAVKMFRSDHSNALPKSFNDLYPEYMTRLDSLVCPSNPDAEVGDAKDIAAWADYEFVAGASGADKETVIVREKSDDFHIPPGRNSLFADGHVSFERNYKF